MDVGTQLRSMYREDQLVALDKVREVLKANPSALDNHSEEKASAEGNSNDGAG